MVKISIEVFTMIINNNNFGLKFQELSAAEAVEQ